MKKLRLMRQSLPSASLSSTTSTETIRASAGIARLLTRSKTLLADDFQQLHVNGALPDDGAPQRLQKSSVALLERGTPIIKNLGEHQAEPGSPSNVSAPQYLEDIALVSMLHLSDNSNDAECEPPKHFTVWNMGWK